MEGLVKIFTKYCRILHLQDTLGNFLLQFLQPLKCGNATISLSLQQNKSNKHEAEIKGYTFPLKQTKWFWKV